MKSKKDAVDAFLDEPIGSDDFDQFLDESARPQSLNPIFSATQTASVEPPAALATSLNTGRDPDLIAEAARGFLGKQSQAASTAERVAHEAGRIGLPAISSIAGQGIGGGIGPVAALGAGVGAGLGTALQAGARAVARTRDQDIPEQTLGQVVSDIGTSAVVNAGSAFLVPKAVGALPKIFDYLATSRVGGGIARPAWEFFKGNVERVMQFVGKGPEVADDVANNLRTVISNSAQQLEDLYKAGIQKLQQGKTGKFRLNLDDAIGDKLRYIARDDVGYTDPTRLADTPEAAYFVQRILGRVDKMREASPLDVFNFQRDLNAAISDNIGLTGKPTSLGVALLKAKDVIREFVEHHPKLKSIAEMNSAWHDAKLIETAARKFESKNDLIGFINSAFRNPLDTLNKRAFERVGALVPEAAEQLLNARAYNAAQAVNPILRSPTGTGLETAPAIGLAGYINPMSLLAAPLLSPRAYALGYQYGPDMARVAASPGLRSAATIGANTLLDYYRGAPSSAR